MRTNCLGLALAAAVITFGPAALAQSAADKAWVRASEPVGAPPSVTVVQAGSAWAAAEDGEPVPLGGARLRLRLVLPGDFGGWAYLPAHLAALSASVTGGELWLASHWSLLLEGAEDPFARQFAGMIAGVRWRLLPANLQLRLSLAAGYTEDLAGGRGLWSELDAADNSGPWHFASAMRASHVWGPATQPAFSANAGAALDLNVARIGLESAVELGNAPRAAVLPYLATPSTSEAVTLRAGPVIPVAGRAALPARVSLFGNF